MTTYTGMNIPEVFDATVVEGKLYTGFLIPNMKDLETGNPKDLRWIFAMVTTLEPDVISQRKKIEKIGCAKPTVRGVRMRNNGAIQQKKETRKTRRGQVL